MSKSQMPSLLPRKANCQRCSLSLKADSTRLRSMRSRPSAINNSTFPVCILERFDREVNGNYCFVWGPDVRFVTDNVACCCGGDRTFQAFLSFWGNLPTL